MHDRRSHRWKHDPTQVEAFRRVAEVWDIVLSETETQPPSEAPTRTINPKRSVSRGDPSMTSKRMVSGIDEIRRRMDHPKPASQELCTKSSPDPDVSPFRVPPPCVRCHRLRHLFGQERTEE